MKLETVTEASYRRRGQSNDEPDGALSAFVLLQVYPLEAAGDDDTTCCLDVIAVDGSEAALEEYLESYEPRFRAACAEFIAWDKDRTDDWGLTHDNKVAELLRKHRVYGSLISAATFKILECLGGRKADAVD